MTACSMGVKPWLRRMLVFATMLLINGANAIEVAEPFGHVSEIAGTWLANGKPLELWSPIPEAAEIRVESPGEFDQLRILRYGRDSFVTFDCAKTEDCARPIKITKMTVPQDSGVKELLAAVRKGIISAVADQFKQFPKKYSHNLARGGELADGVVLGRNGTVDLQPVFRNVERGRYLLRLQPADSDAPSGPAQSPLANYEWDPRSPKGLELGSFKSSLQELLLFQRRGGTFFATGQSAWVLICHPGAYSTVVNEFNDAVSLTEQWGEQVDPTAKATFLRAYLGHLSSRCR